MAAENDIFDKMDALLRKHHPGAFEAREDAAVPPPEGTVDAEPPSENVAIPDSDVPVLTEVIDPPHVKFELDLELAGGDVPVLTDVVEPESSAAVDYPIELDLDPDYEHRHAATEVAAPMLPEEPGYPEQPELAVMLAETASQPEPEGSPVVADSQWAAVSEHTSIVHGPDVSSLEELPPEAVGTSYEEELADTDNAMPMEALQATAPELPVDHGREQQPFSVAAEAVENRPEPTEEHSAEHAPSAPQALISEQLFTQISDSLSEQVLRNIDQKLQQVLEKSIAPQLARTLDKALSSMLDQFSMHIEYTVRESIAQELEKQLNTPVDMSDEHDAGPDRQ